MLPSIISCDGRNWAQRQNYHEETIKSEIAEPDRWPKGQMASLEY